MQLLIIAFAFMMLVSFGIIVVATKPTAEQRALDKRLTHLKAATGQVGGTAGGLLLAEPDKSLQWLDKLADQFKVSERVRVLIVQANSDWTLGKFVMYSTLCSLALGTVTYMFLPKPVIAIAACAQAFFYPYIFLIVKRNRRVNAFNTALADSIDMMARSLRAGHSVVAAIGIVAEQAIEPVKSEFDEVFKKQNYGLPLRECLMQLLDRVPSQDLRVVVTAMLVQKETGGNLAEILDRTCFVIRERVRIHGEIRTHTAQGRMTGYILCALPIVLLVIINFVNPGYSSVLFNTPGGNKLLYVGIGLLSLGAFTIKQIISSIEV